MSCPGAPCSGTKPAIQRPTTRAHHAAKGVRVDDHARASRACATPRHCFDWTKALLGRCRHCWRVPPALTQDGRSWRAPGKGELLLRGRPMSFKAADETAARPRHCGLQWEFRACPGASLALLLAWQAFTFSIRPSLAWLPGISQASAHTASRPDARPIIGI